MASVSRSCQRSKPPRISRTEFWSGCWKIGARHSQRMRHWTWDRLLDLSIGCLAYEQVHASFQDGGCLCPVRGALGSVGRENENVAPVPPSFSAAQSRPWCFSTIEWLTNNPMPIPPLLVVW